ncbi:MAG: ASKHA domain-containing protein [Pseudomonadota bacterium]
MTATSFVLTVHRDGETLRVSHRPGLSVREILDATPLRVRAACGGSGACGACLVRWQAGPVNPPAMAEYLKLDAGERNAGQRLACQARPRGDAVVVLEHPAPPSPWQSLPADDLAEGPGPRPGWAGPPLGLAVDLGTTHVRLALWDIRLGKRIATRRGANPQGVFGADVLNRLAAARSHPARAEELLTLVRQAILEGLRDILARDVGEVTPMLAEIGRVRLVGNSAMLALLAGRGVAELLEPGNWSRPLACQPEDEAVWRAAWHLPHADLALVPPLAGFVGSDLLADLLAVDMLAAPPGTLLLDVGTNSELALWDGQILWITSVPGGPAFEGTGIRHGMPAESGAIQGVAAAAQGSRLDVIGGGPARGYCGSGLVDAIALLRREGLLKASGRFATAPGAEGYRLDPDQPASALTGADVDLFQRAKAALAAAMVHLLGAAGMHWRDLARLHVCGAFGRTLDPLNAQSLGLLPPLPPGRLSTRPDASLAGCEILLLAEDGESRLAEVAGRARCINLALAPDYDEAFIEHLRLTPWRDGFSAGMGSDYN